MMMLTMDTNVTAELILPIRYSSQRTYRLTLPIEMIRTMQLQAGDYVKLQITPVLRPNVPTPQS